jgi:hypothetical protein
VKPGATSEPNANRPFKEKRKYPRFVLRIGLRLRGTKDDGGAFNENVVTAVVSDGGFSCNCLACLAEGTVVEAFLLASEDLLGSARVVHVERTSPPWYNYSFALEKARRDWFLVREQT